MTDISFIGNAMPTVSSSSGAANVTVEILSTPGIARQLTVSTVSANKALTAGITRVSICARGADMRFAIGNTAQTATVTDGVGTSHYLVNGERLEFKVSGFATPNIAAITLSGVGTLEISEYP